MSGINGIGQQRNISCLFNCPSQVSLVFCTYSSYVARNYFPLVCNKLTEQFKFFIIYFLFYIFTENTNFSITHNCHIYSSLLTAVVSSAFSCLDSSSFIVSSASGSLSSSLFFCSTVFIFSLSLSFNDALTCSFFEFSF